ncbi:hypothetical protein F5B22DRAFT_639754 [Xylaria bambusicola]|uniref:uncharacterized protein n=1 Tax=Xylaria bambusicola TaxID=326684 RepID=UPI0020074562|nr:uncharacterized protein F5B22DRAFT_639754 [Xylaria bambusicola]KAI0505695.1 hypothetical protein F5B22DRAFT_639754 [Xylaria bambusicola]
MVNQSDIFNTYPIGNALNAVRRDSRPSSDANDAASSDATSGAVVESTPTTPPLTTPPHSRNSRAVANSLEHRDDMDSLLKSDLGDMRFEVPGFCNTYFSRVPGLDAAHKSPQSPNQYLVLEWFAGVVKDLSIFAEEYETTPMDRRVLVAGPDTPLKGGSPADRKLDVGFARNSDNELGKLPDWSQILVPGELKSNPMADAEKSTWYDMDRYVREVLIAQDTRRFVLGFTLCGSRFRVWEFDRVGGISSDGFDINKNGEQFVYIILGFLWMSKEDLGFDPTVTEKDGQRLITITRNGQPEQFIIDKLMLRTSCIADNIARYYHHETVAIRSQADDVHNNIRGGLNIQDAKSWLKTTVDKHTGESNTRKMNNSKASSKASNATNRKRPASQINAPMPPNKRPCFGSQTIHDSTGPSNREHRRVVLCDYGTPIYEATGSSRAALLKALEGCIHGHSTSPFSFLIDLDLASKEDREGPSGVKGRTGTRAFMAIGLLRDEQHSYMHDLESFFWAGGKPIKESPFDYWNYSNDVFGPFTFKERATKHFTSYYQPLIPCVEALRKELFPDGGDRPRVPDPTLYDRMITVLQEAQRDPEALAGG